MRRYLQDSSLVALILACFALSGSEALAQGSGGVFDLTISQTASTTCSAGEPVALAGNLHVGLSVATTTDTTTSPATVYYVYQATISSDLSGTGQNTGATYTASTAYSGGSQSTSSPAQFTVALRYGLDSHGAAPSLMLNQDVNITADRTGNITATLANSSSDCVDQGSSGI